MNLIFESAMDIALTENHLKHLHQVLLRHGDKDARHLGQYKTLPNDVAAFDDRGVQVGVIFETTPPVRNTAAHAGASGLDEP